MRANKVNAFIRNGIKMSRVAFVDIHFSFDRFVVKIGLFTATVKGNFIYINADNISIEQFCFDKRCAASGKLVEN